MSASQLTARIGAADIATAGTANVTVATPGRPKRVSNPVLLEVITSEQSIPLLSSPTAGTGTVPTVADLNGDGIPDLITLLNSENSNNVAVTLGTGGGQFGPTQTYSVFGAPESLAVGQISNPASVPAWC